MTANRRSDSAVPAALLTAAAMIAHQVAGKATRDTFFLSTFDVEHLPAAVAGAALVSIVAIFAASRWMSVSGPGRVVRMVFAASAGLLLVEWLAAARWERAAAAAVYLHFAAFGALLISGFWSLVSERFDPRTAKRQIARIGAAGTVGGVLGGLLAERMGASFAPTAMLPVLAMIHLVCAMTVRGLIPKETPGAGHADARPAGSADGGALGSSTSPLAALRRLAAAPYLRAIVALVLITAVTEGVVDYVFKARAAAASADSEALMRLFAAFYTMVGVVTFLVQSGLSHRVLDSVGPVRTLAALPVGVGVAASTALVAPGFASAAVAWSTEGVLRNSLFRSGYELLFSPVHRDDRRATKPIIDVGITRVGDMLGAGLVQGALWLGAGAALVALSGVAVVGAAVGVMIALRLHRGYLRALEGSLVARAEQLALSDGIDSVSRTALLTTFGGGPLPDLLDRVGHGIEASVEHERSADADSPSPEEPALDEETRRRLDLRSGDAARVRRALAAPLTRALVPDVILLLAWDELAPDATRALRKLGTRIAGQLVDVLIDAQEEFAIRRRIPAVLAASHSGLAVRGLWLGLSDARFEVRFRCGLALARIPDVADHGTILPADVFGAVERELNVGRGIWENQRLLDRLGDDEASPFVDEYLRDRANRSLEHIFTLLSLVLPRQPLRIAFRGLHTDDQLLRGTALEYLDSVLPPGVRDKLWPLVEDRRPRPAAPRAREDIVAELMRSHESIAMNLQALKERRGSGT